MFINVYGNLAGQIWTGKAIYNTFMEANQNRTFKDAGVSGCGNFFIITHEFEGNLDMDKLNEQVNKRICKLTDE